MTHHPDLVFARRRERELRLDVLRPGGPAPLVVVIHGGGWREGSRKDEGLEWLVDTGLAIARIEYRFSSEAPFPAQIEDCRAAVEWLRTRSANFGWTDAPPCVVGTSAGGMLALLLACESLVCAAVAYCAPCDLLERDRTQPHLTRQPGGVVHDLLAGPVTANPDLARRASPAHGVTASCAPCLLVNGTADPQVLPEQPASFLSHALRAGADVSLISVPGAPHCGPEYHANWIRRHVTDFLHRHARR